MAQPDPGGVRCPLLYPYRPPVLGTMTGRPVRDTPCPASANCANARRCWDVARTRFPDGTARRSPSCATWSAPRVRFTCADSEAIHTIAGGSSACAYASENHVAVLALDLAGMLAMRRLSSTIGRQAVRVLDGELLSDPARDDLRHLCGTREERAEEPDRTELHSEPQPVVITATPANRPPVSLVEMKEPLKLRHRRWLGVAAGSGDLRRAPEVVYGPSPLSLLPGVRGRGRNSARPSRSVPRSAAVSRS